MPALPVAESEQSSGALAAQQEIQHTRWLRKLACLCRKRSFLRATATCVSALNSLPFPWIVKAIEGDIWVRGSKTKVLVRDIAELVDLQKKISDSAVARLMVQEYIPGDDESLWMFNGYFNDRSECLAAFTGRKLRQCPAYTGVASLGCVKRIRP